MENKWFISLSKSIDYSMYIYIVAFILGLIKMNSFTMKLPILPFDIPTYFLILIIPPVAIITFTIYSFKTKDNKEIELLKELKKRYLTKKFFIVFIPLIILSLLIFSLMYYNSDIASTKSFTENMSNPEIYIITQPLLILIPFLSGLANQVVYNNLKLKDKKLSKILKIFIGLGIFVSSILFMFITGWIMMFSFWS